MKINIRYIVFIVLLIILFVVLDAYMPKSYNWTITYYHQDKNPFGAFVLDDVMKKSWDGKYNVSNKSLYFIDSVQADSWLILCDQFKTDKQEIKRFLTWISQGGNALIGAHSYDSLFSDTLQFEVRTFSFSLGVKSIWQNDSMGIHFNDPSLRPSTDYYLPRTMVNRHFANYDSSKTTIIASDDQNHPVAMAMSFGKGRIILTSVPLIFTNYALLKNHNDQVAAGILSYLHRGTLERTEYYQLGSMQSMSPFRYILSEPSLTWAFYLLFSVILLFFLFGAKRDQRIIPVIEPLQNTTVDFIKTVSRLYFHRGDHRDLAVKKILFFTENLKHNFYIRPDATLEEMAHKVAVKTGSNPYKIQKLFEKMHHISRANWISKTELKSLSDEIDRLNEKMILNYK